MEIQAVSVLPDRARFKIAELRRNPALAHDIEGRLRAVPGVRSATANPLAASLLIEIDPAEVDWEALADATPGLCPDAWAGEAANQPQGNAAVVAEVTALFRTLNEKVARATGGIDLRVLVPYGLVVFGLRELLSGTRARPPWYTLFWYAFGTYSRFNRQGGDHAA